ncbi:MAG TPA: SAM-dependent methyltransferase [Trebonia sp.]|jgi:hypothetical protein|nr:SAM-dependent methyltransferase [Trebonia sp.]
MTTDDQAGHGRIADGYTLADIDVSKPNVARVYDVFLGGKDDFGADREFVNKALQVALRGWRAVARGARFPAV